METFNILNKDFPEQDLLINAKGFILFEDFEHKIKSIIYLDSALQEVHNAINDFCTIENRDALGNALINESYTKSVTDIRLHIDLGFHIPKHFLSFLVETLHNCVHTSIAGNIRLTANYSNIAAKEFNIAKAKTDSRKEVQCTGKLVFQSNKECLIQYKNLAFRLENGFFKYPNTASPDIFIMNSTNLHLRGHCFVAEDNIAANMTEITGAFETSMFADITIIIDGKEQKLKKR